MSDPPRSIPLDKQHHPMKLLVSLDMHSLQSQTTVKQSPGRLSVYVSEEIDRYPLKDPKCFKIIVEDSDLPAPNSVAPDEAAYIESNRSSFWRSDFTELKPVISARHAQLDKARAVCAFSANGVSFDDARAKDECYAHLMAAAPRWHLLFTTTVKQTEYLLLIHEDDLANSLYSKAWLVRLPQNELQR